MSRLDSPLFRTEHLAQQSDDVIIICHTVSVTDHAVLDHSVPALMDSCVYCVVAKAQPTSVFVRPLFEGSQGLSQTEG